MMMKFTSLFLSSIIICLTTTTTSADTSDADSLSASDTSSSSSSWQHSMIGGFVPKTSVIDHAEIDLDQSLIEEYLNDGEFDLARKIYEQGAHMRSFAFMTLDYWLTDGMPNNYPRGTLVSGYGPDNKTIVEGTLFHPSQQGDHVIWVDYIIDPNNRDKNCHVGGLDDNANFTYCFAPTGNLTIDGNDEETFLYSYNPATSNSNYLQIQGFSKHAQFDMRRFYNGTYIDGPFYEDYQKFLNYYNRTDYADHWIVSAFDSRVARYGPNRTIVFDFTSISKEGRAQAIQKGTVYMSILMYVIQELEDSLDDCELQQCLGDDATPLCNSDNFMDKESPVHSLDEAVAYYTGSLVGEDGSGEGKLLHSLADTHCIDFNTCTNIGKSKLNHHVLQEFNKMKSTLVVVDDDDEKPDCIGARLYKERIVQLLFVPLIQGTLKYAYILGSEDVNDSDENLVNGAAFAASVLPMVHYCNTTAASIIYQNMKLDSTTTTNTSIVSFKDVKLAFESTYKCLNITCQDIGGYYDVINEEYYLGAEPCSGEYGNIIPDATPPPTITTPDVPVPAPTMPTPPAPVPMPTATSLSNNNNAVQEETTGLTPGAIAGIVIGSIVVMALIAFVIGRQQIGNNNTKNNDPVEFVVKGGDESISSSKGGEESTVAASKSTVV